MSDSITVSHLIYKRTRLGWFLINFARLRADLPELKTRLAGQAKLGYSQNESKWYVTVYQS
ncbi:MAG TPA: hypothetical protein VE643_09930 [Nitrososphaeraceae archaeon]|nr:hypothetical protein [Nitrososphaeraceae archaeon]